MQSRVADVASSKLARATRHHSSSDVDFEEQTEPGRVGPEFSVLLARLGAANVQHESSQIAKSRHRVDDRDLPEPDVERA